MNADFLAVLEFWEREKGISRDSSSVLYRKLCFPRPKKPSAPLANSVCVIDPKNGDIKAFAKLVVSEKVVSKHDQISVFDARRIKADAQVGEEVEVEVTPAGFGRIAAQYAKQALMQQIRRAEKQLIFTEFKDRVGDIISGTVRRFERSDVMSISANTKRCCRTANVFRPKNIRSANAFAASLRLSKMVRMGRKLFFPAPIPNFVIKLFQLEVSEINDGTIEVKGIAREPGFRTKLAVYTRDEKVDPVGACVGLRGQRVKNIVRELNNEKVDIIRWDPNVKNFIANALSPAKLKLSKSMRPQAGEDYRQLKTSCRWPSANAGKMRG